MTGCNGCDKEDTTQGWVGLELMYTTYRDESELSCSAHIGMSPAWVAQHIQGWFLLELLHHRER